MAGEMQDAAVGKLLVHYVMLRFEDYLLLNC